jgi:hypothetical protein
MASKFDFSDLDKYKETESKFDFSDLDDYKEAKAPVESEPEISKEEAVLQGLTQGATLGFGEEAGAAALTPLEIARRTISKYIPGTPEQVDESLREKGFKLPEEPGVVETYKQLRDPAREAYATAQEEFPIETMGAEIVGGIAPAIATGGAGALSKEGLKAAAKAAVRESGEEVTKQALKRAAAKKAVTESAKAGAAFGGATGLGQTEDITDLPQVAQDVAIGTTLGGAIGGATPVAMQGLKGIGKGTGKMVEGIRDKVPIIDKTLAAAERYRKGERFLGKKAREEMFDEQRQLVKDAFEELETIDRSFGQKTGEILAKAENKIDIADDVRALSKEMREKAQEYGRAGFESQQKRVEGMANQLDDILSTGERTVSGQDLAKQEAVRKAKAIQQDARVDAANAPEPKLSPTKIDPETKTVSYTDANTGKVTSVMYDFDESFVDEFADEATQYARAATTRERAVQEKTQRILAENRRAQGSEVDILMDDIVQPIDEEDAYKMADAAISEVNFDDETKRFVVFDEDTGKPFAYEPKYVTKEEASNIINRKRAIDLKNQKSKAELAKADTEMIVKEDPTTERFVIYSKQNGRLKKRGEVRYKKDQTVEGEMLAKTDIDAPELDRLTRAQSEKYRADQDLGVQRESAQMLNLLRQKTKQAIGGEAAEEFAGLKGKSSLLKTIRDTLSPGLSSGDKAKKERALKSLQDALAKSEDSEAIYTSFKQFFDDIAQVDPAYSAKYRKQFMDLAERMALGDPSNVGAHSVSPRAVAGTVESIGVSAGALSGRVMGGFDALAKMPKTVMTQTADTLSTHSNPAARQLGNVLHDMANSSKTRRDALIFSISQNPTYKRILEEELGVDFSKK